MTKALRFVGLAAILALSILPDAGAAAGDCHILCADNSSWVGYTNTWQQCCARFAELCGSYGDAYYELQGPWGVDPQYCVSYGF